MKKLLLLSILIISVSLFAVDFRVDLYDTFDDWNGGSLSVSVNGTVVLADITLTINYGPETYFFEVEDGDTVFMDYTPGGWPEENEYYVFNNAAELIESSGQNNSIPEDITFIAVVAAASYGAIDGTVTDMESNPIAEAQINITNELFSYTTYTDVDGYYNQEVTAEMGDYDLTCTAQDWISESVSDVSVLAGETVTIDFQLEHIPGEDIEYPFIITDFPFTGSGDTYLFLDDYEMGVGYPSFSDAPDVVYAFTIEDFQNVSVSLEGSAYDTQLGVYAQGTYPSFNNHLYYNDDFDFTTRMSLDELRTKEENQRDRSLQSAIMDMPLQPGTYYIVIDGMWGNSGNYQIEVTVDDYVPSPYDEDFEEGVIPQGWIVIDNENDGRSWEAAQLTFDFDEAYSGEWFARVFVQNYYNPIDSDDWLITPALIPSVEDNLVEFYCRGVSEFWTENLQIRLSTTGTEIEDFDILLDDITIIEDETWQLYSYDLSAYNDQQVYVAFVYLSEVDPGFALDIDAVSLPISHFDTDMTVLSLEPNYAPVSGEENIYKVKVKNMGIETADYSVKLYNGNDEELASAAGVNLFYNQTYIFDLIWSPTEVEIIDVYAKVEIVGDENPDNNESFIYTVYVQPAGTVFNAVGQENNTSGSEPQYMPIVTLYQNSVSETIYLSDDLSGAGLITAVSYQYDFESGTTDFGLVVRMGETEENDLSEGVILAGELDIVFDNTVSFDPQDNTLIIPLDNPYIYNGGNLVIMIEHPVGQTLGGYNKFYISSVPGGSQMTACVASDGVPIDPYEPNGAYVYFGYIPNTGIYIINSGLGALQGFVSNDIGEMLEGAELVLENDDYNLIKTSDWNGFYSFDYVPQGTYDLTINYFGYMETIINDIVITEGSTTTIDVTMSLIPQITVSGNIFGNDAPTVGITGAEIRLEGYGNFVTTSDANGYFQFDNVYGGYDYQITITANRFETYSSVVTALFENILLDDIVLIELLLPVTALLAEINEDETVAEITWNEASQGIQEEFRYDDGVVISGLGFSTGNEYSIFGSVYPNDAQIDQLSWFLRDWAYHSEARLLLLGLNENGIPNSDEIIFDSGMIANTDEQWNVYTLENPLVIEGGFYFGVMTPGIATYIGMDDGLNAPYEFVYNTHYYNWDMNSNTGWVANEDGGASGFLQNYLLRVNGLNLGENNFVRDTNVSKSPKTKKSSLPELHKSNPIATGSPAFRNFTSGSNSREVLGYNVFRLISYDLYNPDDWIEIASNIPETSFSDTDWINLSGGMYYYAVSANFANGVSSANISNMVAKNMIAAVTINVETPEGNAATGAEVILYNEDYEYSGTIDANGELELTEVWLGSYTLEISLDGYSFYFEENLDIYYSQQIDVILIDILIHPFNIQAVYDEDSNTADISWETPEPEIYEFRFDDGDLAGGIVAPANPNNLLGAAFRNEAYVSSVSWMTVPSAPHTEVNVVILGLDENQIPDQNQVLYVSGMIPNVDQEWSSHNLTEAVNAPNGFYVGISTPDLSLGIAYDDGEGDPYPFMENTFMGCDDWTDGENDWTLIDDYQTNNLFIRAYGINYSELVTRDQASWIQKSNKSTFYEYELIGGIISSPEEPEVTERSLLSYNVYQLLQGDENSPENWILIAEELEETSFTDDSFDENGTYLYAIIAVYSGNHISEAGFSNTIEVTNVAADNSDITPLITKLNGNYPNPFNPTTTISFSLKQAGEVSLQIFNIKGQLVKTLINEYLEAAQHDILWNGKDNNNNNVASGIYFYKMKADRHTSAKKMILMK